MSNSSAKSGGIGLSVNKEAIYDEHINPLIAQVIKLCKQYEINMAATFFLGFPPDHEDECPMQCSTVLSFKGTDEFERERIAVIRREIVGPPQFAAITITTSKAAP